MMTDEDRTSLGELILREYLSLFFSGRYVQYNHRPDWLRMPCSCCHGEGTVNRGGVAIPCPARCDEGLATQPLELDIYYPPDLAFEFQGGQHTRSVLGGKSVPRRAERRDEFKLMACAQQGVKLYQIFPPGLSYKGLAATLERTLPDEVRRGMTFVMLEAQAKRYRK